jgi:6-pyruvoyltetrahydropterin/6-carboxytetrahydropterin synthase
MAYTVCTELRFAAAHFIRGHQGGCENVHGHNYRVRVCVRSETLDSLGMVIDFADLKALTRQVVGRFDHRLINEVAPFDQENTTAELLAAHVFHELAPRLTDPRLELARVEVWENEASCAVFEKSPQA